MHPLFGAAAARGNSAVASFTPPPGVYDYTDLPTNMTSLGTISAAQPVRWEWSRTNGSALNNTVTPASGSNGSFYSQQSDARYSSITATYSPISQTVVVTAKDPVTFAVLGTWTITTKASGDNAT